MSEPSDITLVSRAAVFAARRHSGQTRKGEAGEPYLNHLAEVAALLAESGADAELVAAGWLHDTVEDTGASREDVVAAFGERVAAIVMECTDDKSLPKEERKRLQVVNTPHKSEAARRLKLADKTSNLRDIAASPPANWPIERCFAYVDWAEQVARSCLNLSPHLDRTFADAVAAARAAIAARADGQAA